MKKFFTELGISESQNIIVHSSYKKIKSAFPNITPTEVIRTLQELITPNGSLIMPAFTYCFKSLEGEQETFDRLNTKSKVGLLSEVFRKSENVIRTSSPTHSFSMWGKITTEISCANSPQSPLGKGSVLDWFSKNDNSFVLMLGTHFDSLSICHYLEVIAQVPWYNCFPWEHLGKLNIGVSTTGEQQLIEGPGCSKSFIKFEEFLLESKIIKPKGYNGLLTYFIPIPLLIREGLIFFKNNFKLLLCSPSTCSACDFRRNKFLN